MRTLKINSLMVIAIIVWLAISCVIIQTAHGQSKEDRPLDQKTFMELAEADSVMFNAAFNTCQIKTVEGILDEGFEFYPDQGVSTYSTNQSRKEFLDGIQKNFCRLDSGTTGKMRREIDLASVRIYPLSHQELLQTGTQRFYLINAGQPDKLVEVSAFTRTWHKKNGDWKMLREFEAIENTYAVHPSQLYDTIASMDSVLFAAFNEHNLDKLKTFFTPDLEFYHDLTGLTNYAQNMQAFAGNFSKGNDLHRELVRGTLEVYPVKDYGAMEIGEHKFCHHENGSLVCGTFKFSMVWKKTSEGWKISRVLSYGH
jgi:hypothetical protein